MPARYYHHSEFKYSCNFTWWGWPFRVSRPRKRTGCWAWGHWTGVWRAGRGKSRSRWHHCRVAGRKCWREQSSRFLSLFYKIIILKNCLLKFRQEKMNQLLSELSPAKYRKRSTNMLRVGELSVLGTVRAVQAHLLAGYRRSS